MLLGLAQLLKATARVIEGPDANVSVRVKSVREGSFEVWLALGIDGAKIAWEMWKQSPDAQAAAVLLGFLGFTVTEAVGGAVVGAVGLIRRMRGRSPSRMSPSRPGMISVEIDSDIFEVPEIVVRIASDAAVRATLEKVVSEPLERDGIESVSLGDGPAQKIEKAEAAFFRVGAWAAMDEFESRHVKIFSIVTLSFKQGQKWRLSDGHSTPLVAVSDIEFQSRVDSGLESFDKRDLLICDVVEKSRRTPTGFKSDYEIVRVREHRTLSPAVTLAFSHSPSDDVP